MKDLIISEWWRRVLNFLIDMVVLFLILVLIIFIYDKSNATTGFQGLIEFLRFLDHIYIIMIIVFFLYYLILESIFGRTIGKIITSTRVVDYEGNKSSFWRILLRTIIRLIPIEWISFFSQTPVGWHDSLSKTKVIQK